MAKNQKAMAYAREREAHNKDAPYAEKFADFIKIVAQAKATGCEIIIIAEPWVIGDTYDEVIESLSHLAGTSIGLNIVTAGKAPWNN
jgi:hypothetical protein